MVRVVRDALEEVEIHTFGINLCKRDDEMGREPAMGLDREEGRQFVLGVLEDRERLHSVVGVELLANHEAVLDELEAMDGRFLRGMQCECARRDKDKYRDEIAAK